MVLETFLRALRALTYELQLALGAWMDLRVVDRRGCAPTLLPIAPWQAAQMIHT
jgi:hypothetical protein